MQIDVPDEDLNGFSQNARDQLQHVTNEYVTDVIEEANRLEATRSNSGKPPEVTSSMVDDANVLVRRGLIQSKGNYKLKILRISAAILSILAGILFDFGEFQNPVYMVVYLVVIAAAILTVTFSVIKE